MPGPRRPINSCIALDDYGSPIVHSRTTSVLEPPRALLATGGHPGRGPSLHSPLFYWDAPLRCVRLAHCALHQASPHSLARRAGWMTALLAELISVLAVMETRGGREMVERWWRDGEEGQQIQTLVVLSPIRLMFAFASTSPSPSPHEVAAESGVSAHTVLILFSPHGQSRISHCDGIGSSHDGSHAELGPPFPCPSPSPSGLGWT